MLISSMNRFDIHDPGNDRRATARGHSRLKPDVILMDIKMPGMDGVAATKAIHERWPAVRIIILTSFKEKELIAVAVTAVLKCDECFKLHSAKAMEAGATKYEILESLLVAMFLAGPSVVVGLPSVEEFMSC
jgi:AhpD family alkylhydroperoxidase